VKGIVVVLMSCVFVSCLQHCGSSCVVVQQTLLLQCIMIPRVHWSASKSYTVIFHSCAPTDASQHHSCGIWKVLMITEFVS